MNNTDANRIPARELKDELARLCLPAANRDPNRKLAWMNSICILFLLIGIFGAAPAAVSIKPVPPIEEIAPVALETPPPQTVTPTPEENQNPEQQPPAPNVVVVVPNAPNISFSVPTIGNLVAPAAMAQAPPLNPMQPVNEPVNQLARISNTGASGSRPEPAPYPPIARDAGEQGTVTLQMTANSDGRVASLQIMHSSGFPVLDRFTEDFIRRHWRLPAGASPNQLFETSIIYQLQGD